VTFRFFYISVLFTVTSFAQSDKLLQKTYTTQDGIEINLIKTLSFDNDGFLWLGGSNQDIRAIMLNDKNLVLQRFNGANFHSIQLPIYENKIEEVQHLYKRKDGKFYVIVKLNIGHKLLLFDPFTCKFKEVSFKDSHTNLSGLSNVFSYKNKDYILTQKDRTISFRRLNLDLSTTELFSFTTTEKKFLIEGSSSIIPFEDFIYISDDNFNIKVFNWEGKLIKTIDTVSTINSTQSKRVFINKFFIEKGIYYLFLNNNPTLYKVNETSKNIDIVTNTTLSNTRLNTFTDPQGKAMVFASKNNELTFHILKKDKLEQEHLFNSESLGRIQTISKNLNEDVWLATNGKLHYYKFPSKVIQNYLPKDAIRAITELDSANYLVSTQEHGWHVVNPIDKCTTPYTTSSTENQIEMNDARNFIKEDSIIWSSGNSGILKVNTHSKAVKSFKHYPVICMEKPNDSIIVYGTNRYHLMQFNTKTEEHTSLVKTDTLFIYDIEVQKHNNIILAGTDKGLLTYNLINKQSEFYDHKDIEDPFILMLDYHKDYGYLLGTRAGHVIAFNLEKQNFTTLYKDDLKAGIASILFKDDTWWINTFNGIVVFNPKTKTKTRFSEKDGLSHYETNRYSALKTKDHFFVGTIKGLNYFNPEELKTENDSAALTLLKINQYDKVEKTFKNNYNRSLFNNNTTITLPTENRRLEIDFALKNIDAVDKGYSYRYRLNNKSWIDLNQQNTIQFANLAAGDYQLEIQAQDFSGNNIANALVLDIHSKEFFYKTWWFYLLVLSLISAFLLWLLEQAKHKRVLQETFSQGLIQSQENERKRIAKELHDSVSQQLTLIKKKAQKTNQDDITALTHNTLEEVRAISRGLYPPLLKQLGLSESIEQLIQDVDEQTNMYVSGDIDVIDAYFNETDTLNCYRFIQECINNILKHANAKALSVNVTKHQNTIEIAIKDNGKGFDVITEEKKNSLGLKTMYERIRILKGELTIDSKSNSGTTIMAVIPIKHV